MTAKEQRKDSATIFEAAGAISVATSGTFYVLLTPTLTAIPAGVYYYDVTVTISSNRYVAEYGTLTVHNNITT